MSAKKKAAQPFSAETDSRRFRVDRLQQRVLNLESRMGQGSGFRSTAGSVFQECVACQRRIDTEQEDNPSLRELQEKFTKYHFKLIEVRNENLLLKRDLAVAKKVMCQELGIDDINFQRLLKHGSAEGWRGRREKLLVLKQKNQELQDKLREREDNPKSSSSKSEETKDAPEEKTGAWRMLYEKRKGYEMGGKERNDLAAENTDLRKKLQQFKNRLRELTNENEMLKGECYNYSEKSRQDNNIAKSLKNAEDQLKVALEDRSEMRRLLLAEKSRNNTMRDNVELLRNQVDVNNESSALDKRIIDNLTIQNQRLQDNLDNENIMSGQANEKFKQELKRMIGNHKADQDMVQRMENAITKKNEMVRVLEEKLSELSNFLSEKARLEEEKKKEKEDEEGEEEDEDEEEKEEGEEGEDDEQPQVPTPMKLLQMDLSQYKTLYETSKSENQSMGEMIATLNMKVNELSANLIFSQEKYLINERDRKELQEKVKRLQGTIKEKKKGVKPWDTSKPTYAVPARTKIDELNIKLEVLMEENNFLRNFLSNTISSKENDLQLYRMLAENAEVQYETSIQVMKSELTIGVDEGEEGEDEED